MCEVSWPKSLLVNSPTGNTFLFFKSTKPINRISPKQIYCTLALSTTAERHSTTRLSLQKLFHGDGIFIFELGWTELEQITMPSEIFCRAVQKSVNKLFLHFLFSPRSCNSSRSKQTMKSLFKQINKKAQSIILTWQAIPGVVGQIMTCFY